MLPCVPRRVLTVAMLVIAALVADFHYVYRYPSAGLIAFISKVTANSLPPRTAHGGSAAGRDVHEVASPGGAAASPDGHRHHHRRTPVSVPPPVVAAIGAASSKHSASPPPPVEEGPSVATGARRKLLGFNAAPGSLPLAPVQNNNNAESAADSGGAAAEGVVAKQQDAAGSATASSPSSPAPATKPNFRHLRFNAKLHMVNQFQLFIDYPLGYWLVVDLGLGHLTWLSANLISIIHPFFGMAAGYLIVKAANIQDSGKGSSGNAASSGKDNNNKEVSVEPMMMSAAAISTSSLHHEKAPLTAGGGSAGGGSNKAATAGSSHHARSASNLVTSPSGPSSVTLLGCLMEQRREAAHGGMPPGTSPIAKMAPSNNSSTAVAAIEASPRHPASTPLTLTTGGVDFGAYNHEIVYGTAAGDNGLDQRRAMLSSVNMKYLRIAAVLFFIRNFLDTLDGVVARVQRHYSGVTAAGSTTMGFNGHSLDMVTDTLGGACVAVAICILLFSKNLVVARLPSALLVKLGYRNLLQQKDKIFVKVLVVVGLCHVGVTGMCWETFMLRYANLFDQHANTNAEIFALDNNFSVRLTQILWAFSCGDSILFYTIIAIATNRMWEFVQLQLFVGYPWLITLTMYSFWVWHRVILANPTAALIVAENPDQFM